MKNSKLIKISLVILACFSLLTVQGQNKKNRSGIRVGLNASNLFVDKVKDENARLGFHIGVFKQMGLGSVVFQPELNYTTKGTRAEYFGIFYEGEGDFNLNYLEMPLLAVFKLNGVDIHLGPYFGYLVRANLETDDNFFNTETDLDRDNFQSFDYGISGGLAVNFTAISVGVRYNYGLQEVADSVLGDSLLGNARNATGQIYMAFNMN
ncbi:PorT family protein [Fulvivirga sp. M361]|uniref:porin family protein n=1 Tax=Fulvivirga sp. M361 TaxID=2594266 RepID=UPI00117B4B82|nr:porin family protein [Fulvivirga sp. M361]TRX60547.1 PorT family protein [Fulvivirga sp. M361]